MLSSGIDPYPATYPRTTSVALLRDEYGSLPPDTATGTIAGVAGRVILSRIGGKLCFATLRDGTGDIQGMISLAGVGVFGAGGLVRDPRQVAAAAAGQARRADRPRVAGQAALRGPHRQPAS